MATSALMETAAESDRRQRDDAGPGPGPAGSSKDSHAQIQSRIDHDDDGLELLVSPLVGHLSDVSDNEEGRLKVVDLEALSRDSQPSTSSINSFIGIPSNISSSAKLSLPSSNCLYAASAIAAQLYNTLPIPPSPVSSKPPATRRQDSKICLDAMECSLSQPNVVVSSAVVSYPIESSPYPSGFCSPAVHVDCQNPYDEPSFLMSPTILEPDPDQNYLCPSVPPSAAHHFHTHHSNHYSNHFLHQPQQYTHSDSSASSDMEDDTDDDEVFDLMREEGGDVCTQGEDAESQTEEYQELEDIAKVEEAEDDDSSANVDVLEQIRHNHLLNQYIKQRLAGFDVPFPITCQDSSSGSDASDSGSSSDSESDGDNDIHPMLLNDLEISPTSGNQRRTRQNFSNFLHNPFNQTAINPSIGNGNSGGVFKKKIKLVFGKDSPSASVQPQQPTSAISSTYPFYPRRTSLAALPVVEPDNESSRSHSVTFSDEVDYVEEEPSMEDVRDDSFFKHQNGTMGQTGMRRRTRTGTVAYIPQPEKLQEKLPGKRGRRPGSVLVDGRVMNPGEGDSPMVPAKAPVKTANRRSSNALSRRRSSISMSSIPLSAESTTPSLEPPESVGQIIDSRSSSISNPLQPASAFSLSSQPQQQIPESSLSAKSLKNTTLISQSPPSLPLPRRESPVDFKSEASPFPSLLIELPTVTSPPPPHVPIPPPIAEIRLELPTISLPTAVKRKSVDASIPSTTKRRASSALLIDDSDESDTEAAGKAPETSRRSSGRGVGAAGRGRGRGRGKRGGAALSGGSRRGSVKLDKKETQEEEEYVVSSEGEDSAVTQMEPVVDDVVMEEASSSKSVESTPSLATTTAPSPPAIVLEKAAKKSAKKERPPTKKKEQLVPSVSQPVVLNTYSKIEVWECNIKNIGLMRRVKDGWFNATQILKLAGYGEKAKRSKILEKMHLGIHEKVQGGFGRYQGTWIPRARALELAEEYNVVGLLKPMFECSESDTMIDMQLYTKPNKKENVEGAEIM